MKTKILILLLIFSSFMYGQNELYELRAYDLNFGKSPNGFYGYIENALIPALNRQGINDIGFFEEVGGALPKKVYLLIPYKSMNGFDQVTVGLEKDALFIEAAKQYMEMPKDKFPVKRYTISLFKAFDGLPKMLKPEKNSMIFELRTYEGYNEDAVNRKVKMFNEGELDIFHEVGLHSVFFGEKISGPNMPCLTYMLAFKDMSEREENWKKFGPHPEWKRIVKLPEYANTVSNISRVFLKPFSFSQL
jgi:hypothetical protein